MNMLMAPLKHKTKCRVQLHIHLDSALRHETLWEIMRQRGVRLPGSGSLADFRDFVGVKETKDLAHFLKGKKYYMDYLVGNLDLIDRMAYEFVEDQAKDNVAYCEARFCPNMYVPNCVASRENVDADGYAGDSSGDHCLQDSVRSIRSDDIVKTVLKAFKRGEENFGTKVTLILSCMRGHSHWSWDILRLCEEYKDEGVVGIDIAGHPLVTAEEDNLHPIDVAVFQAAKARGIHRTVHSGEAGPASGVQAAVEILGAERIGHGYRVIEDEAIYDMCKREVIHFETCPYSSYLTGCMRELTLIQNSERHPILRFAEDEASFSINTDDPTLTLSTLSDEYKLLSGFGFTEAQITRANFQAALHSFLGPEEKRKLVEHLKKAYGIVDYHPPVPSPSTAEFKNLKPSVTFGTWSERT